MYLYILEMDSFVFFFVILMRHFPFDHSIWTFGVRLDCRLASQKHASFVFDSNIASGRDANRIINLRFFRKWSNDCRSIDHYGYRNRTVCSLRRQMSKKKLQMCVLLIHCFRCRTTNKKIMLVSKRKNGLKRILWAKCEIMVYLLLWNVM